MAIIYVDVQKVYQLTMTVAQRMMMEAALILLKLFMLKIDSTMLEL